MRLAREAGEPPAGTPLSRRLVRSALRRLATSLDSTGEIRHCDALLGISETGRLELPALTAALARVPAGWTELMAHPGLPDPELRRDYPWGYSWEAETRALTSAEARREVERLGITLDRE